MARWLRCKKGASWTGRGAATICAFLVLSALLIPLPVAASEDPGTVALAVAPPNATTVGFAPNVLAISQGGSLNIVGADLQVHNIACVKFNRKTKRPLCQSAYAALGETKPVVGVEKLKVGTYPLICQAHPQMKVELRVVGP
jgi:plastocyanin